MAFTDSIVEELSNRNISLFIPIGVNLTIHLLWVIFKSFSKVRSDYRASREAIAGGMSIFVSTQIIIYLFSFIVTLAAFVSLNFLSKTRGSLGSQSLWWLPSIVSISMAEISKFLAKILKGRDETEPEEEEGELEEKTRQLSYYFFISVIVIGGLWVYIIFGEDINLFYGVFELVDEFLL